MRYHIPPDCSTLKISLLRSSIAFDSSVSYYVVEFSNRNF